MITYIYVIIVSFFIWFLIRTKKEKKNKNEITIEYLHWKKLYYKSLALNNIKTGMANWKSCNF
jgi:hypothetical protein